MKILVTGNLGYIGPVLSKVIKKELPKCSLIGLDSGFFYQCNTSFSRHGDTYYDKQVFKDVRDISKDDLENIDHIIHLAAISNDPMGKEFEKVTNEINQESTIRLAKLASEVKVKSFTFASSCSMYGFGGEGAKNENDSTNPLTAYAKSKIGVENALKSQLDQNDMKITCLRFSTACGSSSRLRLDLVLNDFVASATKYKLIKILSDGSPWRPLIDVEDMARAMIWAIFRDDSEKLLSVNVGSNEWNYQIKDLAVAVKDIIPEAEIEINEDAEPDKRSYKVDFNLFKSLAGELYPRKKVSESINELYDLIQKINLPLDGFRSTNYLRLNHLKNFQANGMLDDELKWVI